MFGWAKDAAALLEGRAEPTGPLAFCAAPDEKIHSKSEHFRQRWQALKRRQKKSAARRGWPLEGIGGNDALGRGLKPREQCAGPQGTMRDAHI
jgi:hypothetical protein